MAEITANFCYCDYVLLETSNPIHRKYHDFEYGFPQTADNVLLERLTHEVFQAGLSWEIILKKKEAFYDAFDAFDVNKVAGYGPEKIEELLQNPKIIRNQRKILATIYNANRILELGKEYGSFKAWIDVNHPHQLEDWIKILKSQFKFMGKEVVSTFLQSLGYLPEAHTEYCPIYNEILKLSPPWLSEREFFGI